MTGPAKLPPEIYSSAHQVKHDNSLLGEYEMHIYRGVDGPVVVFHATATSPLPLEYLSERATLTFIESLPVRGTRFFERHTRGTAEIWIEILVQGEGFRRAVCSANDVLSAVSRLDSDQAFSGEPTSFHAARRS